MYLVPFTTESAAICQWNMHTIAGMYRSIKTTTARAVLFRIWITIRSRQPAACGTSSPAVQFEQHSCYACRKYENGNDGVLGAKVLLVSANAVLNQNQNRHVPSLRTKQEDSRISLLARICSANCPTLVPPEIA